MVFFDMQDFGGLEEYATNLAIDLQAQGHSVSMWSFAWISPENQYAQRLKEKDIPLLQPPAWISRAASDWPTKERILRGVMWFCTPLTVLLTAVHAIFTRRPPGQAWTSAYNWLKGHLMARLIGPDRRKTLGRIFLQLWTSRWRPDVLHLHGFGPSLMFVIEWAHARRLPVVYEEHATPDPQFDAWTNGSKSISKAARVIAVSEKSAQALTRVCGVPQPIVVKGPLLPDPFASGWQKRNGNSSKYCPLTVTTIARLFPMKGLDHLLEAAAIVKATHPETQFKIYGDGELRTALTAKAESLGLGNDKIFEGAFTDRHVLSQILVKTDIFLLSSILEGQPVVIVEAMAHGNPIIATAVGGVPELIQDGVNGLLCKPADAEALAKQIIRLIENPSLRASLGAAARASYEQGPFQVRTASLRFLSIYQDVLTGQGGV